MWHSYLNRDEDYIIHCYGVTKNPETAEYFMVLDYAEMGSLSVLLKNVHNIDWVETQEMLLGVAKGLEAVHQQGILHRDLHLGNIFVHNNGHASIGGLGSCSFIDDNSINKLKGFIFMSFVNNIHLC